MDIRRKRAFGIIITLGCILGLSAYLYAQPTTYHVAAQGSGSVCGANAPCTIDTALSRAKSGDRILFWAGDCPCGFNTQRDGVTFEGAPNHATRLLWRDGNEGRQIIGVRHSNTTIRGLVIDGEKKPNSGHGLLRMATASNVIIEHNIFKDSGSSMINLGGSWKQSRIDNVIIRGNRLVGSGLREEHGEPIYVGDYNGTGMVTNVDVYNNIIQQFTDNGVDTKPPTRNVRVYHNWFADQIMRPHKREPNTGAVVLQGLGHEVRDNIFERIRGGKAVFNVTSSGNHHVHSNAIMSVDERNTDSLVRSRGNASAAPSRVRNNHFCTQSLTKIHPNQGLIITENYGVDRQRANCVARANEIKAAMRQYGGGVLDPVDPPPPPPPPPPPEVLPPLVVDRVTYQEVGSNVVRVYVKTADGSDPQIDKRLFQDSSVFFRAPRDCNAGEQPVLGLCGHLLTFRRQDPSKPDQEPGWRFLLDAPWPDGRIHMRALQGWITGAPAIDMMVPSFTTTPDPDPDPEPDPEPEPDPDPEPDPEPDPPPTIELQPGQAAECATGFEHPVGDVKVMCGEATP